MGSLNSRKIGGHERAVFDSFADGLGLNSQVGALEQFAKLFNEGSEAGFFVQVGGVDPVPGKVFHENGGNIEFLAEHESEGGDAAEDEVGLRFPEDFSGFFEGRFVESKEALEPGDGLVEVVLEGGFLDESDAGFEPVGVEGHLGGKIFPPEPVGQGAEYLDGQSRARFGQGPLAGRRLPGWRDRIRERLRNRLCCRPSDATSGSEEEFKVDEELLGGDERVSFFHDEFAAGLLLGREIEAEHLILGRLGCHGLDSRFDPDGYAERTEGTVPSGCLILGRRFAESRVASDEIGRAI